MAEPGATEAKSDPQAAAKIEEYLRRYSPSAGDTTRDILNGRYRIELSTPLPEFDSKTARAYAATDLTDSTQVIIAEVCIAGSTQRQRVIDLLVPINHPHILSVVAAGPVALSRPDEERFVIFHQRPAGQKLSEFLAKQPAPLNPHFLCDRIIAPLAAALQQFSDLGIAHGTVNPDNIYITDSATLGPCVAAPCGFSQPFYYEPLERMQAMPGGKGEGTTAQDYYALAVVTLYALFGPQHFAHLTPDYLIRLILREGASDALTRQRDMPEIFQDFFRGMLCPNSADRWNWNEIKPWIGGKRYNVLSPAPVEAMRPFEFGEIQAMTRRELVHILVTDWDKMAETARQRKSDAMGVGVPAQ